MTAQIGDSYSYKGSNYSIVAMSVPLHFDPSLHGFKPASVTTACWNGFWCKYKISDEGIFLDKLYIHCDNDNYPELNGKSFDVNEEGKPVEYMGHRVYNDLNIKIEYSGKILVGSGFILDYYIHRGYQRAYAYKVLKEFVFHDGKLIDVIDHSDIAAKLREIVDRLLEESKRKDGPKRFFKSLPYTAMESYLLDYKGKYWWLV